jgi:hypothetical protein
MSMQYQLRATAFVLVLFSVIGLTACGGGGGGGDGSGTPAPAPTPTPPPPSTGSAQLRITWQNSYIYQSSGTDNTYWYAQVVYQNISNQPLTITCAGRTDPSMVKEHTDAGTFAATETYCSRNPDITRDIAPGGAHYEYAIFNKVPATGNVVLEWENYGKSQGVNPWTTPYPANTPHPTECPSGTCQSTTPEGKAANLIVLVHGCCTDAQHVYEWRALADAIIGEILKSQTPDAWEIVVLDWHEFTPPPPGPIDQIFFKTYADIAYIYADTIEGPLLANIIEDYSNKYKYIHLVGHSAGAKLIQRAATDLVRNNKIQQANPFIHLTFLDAYTQTKQDSGEEDNKGYGYLEGYPNHYSEHYVDMDLPSTDAILKNAFNFDITHWDKANKGSGFDAITGHQWPRYWYEQSVSTPFSSQTSGFATGYPLSFEGGNNAYNTLSQKFRPGDSCQLTDVLTTAICGIR